MNRIIKFRAWDKIVGKMWEPAVYKGELYAASPLGGFVIMDGELKDPLMQFTGLTDKNGVDIYEGDIVKEIRLLHDGYCGTNHEVKYKAPSFMVGDIDLSTYLGITREVIGNIYENPELLN